MYIVFGVSDFAYASLIAFIRSIINHTPSDIDSSSVSLRIVMRW